MPGEVHETVEADHRSETGVYRVLYIGTGRLRALVDDGALPFFPEAVLRDRDLIERFEHLHASFDDPASRLGSDVHLMSLLAALRAGNAGPLETTSSSAGTRSTSRVG